MNVHLPLGVVMEVELSQQAVTLGNLVPRRTAIQLESKRCFASDMFPTRLRRRGGAGRVGDEPSRNARATRCSPHELTVCGSSPRSLRSGMTILVCASVSLDMRASMTMTREASHWTTAARRAALTSLAAMASMSSVCS